jgi:hypothetical protein
MTTTVPTGFVRAKADVPWRDEYLQLEGPAAVHTLAEFGDREDAEALSPVAVSEPFRVLSEEGVRHALAVARELESLAVGDARSKRLRGCTYRSDFFAGLYSDPRLISFLSGLAQADLRPHPVGHHRIQLNFAPDELGKEVDVWHHDVVSYDFVMLLTDPDGMRGGHTEYFQGTLEEGMELLERDGAIPPERIAHVGYPAGGWAFLQQGHRVLHRAAGLEEPYPRISLVASYYCSDPAGREPTILPPLRKADGREIALVEWSSYAAHRTIERLQRFIDSQPNFAVPLEEVRRDLAGCLAEAEQALAEFDSKDEGYIIGLDG